MSWTNYDLVEVREVAGERGAFALRDIPEGTVVGVFDGMVEVFSVDDLGNVDWRGHDGGMSIHLALRNGQLFTLMPIPGHDIAGIDFINHSCTPNCRADGGILVVETIKSVACGEQLAINYHDMDLVKMGLPCWCAGVDPDKCCML